MPVKPLGEKAVACLRMAEALHDRTITNWEDRDAKWDELYAQACDRYSEKAVITKFEELDRRRYIDSGVSSRTGWLTDKGKAALQASAHI
jgi:hypothetical protein